MCVTRTQTATRNTTNQPFRRPNHARQRHRLRYRNRNHTCPANDTTPIGGYHNGLPVAWLPTGWKAERDGSIRTPAGRKPCEFVSPILRGYEGLQNVETAVDAIKERGARVNESCGLHITVSWNGDAAALARLISLIGNHEKAIYASTGTRRRERNHWAKQIKTYGNKDAAKTRCEARPLPPFEPDAPGRAARTGSRFGPSPARSTKPN